MPSLTILDKQVVLSLSALAIVPIGNMYQVSLGFAILNLHDILLLYLLLVVFLIMVKRGYRKTGLALSFATISVFILYILLSPVPLREAVSQARFYFPFIVATTMLSTINYGDSRIILNWIALAIGISAFIAILMHLFFRDTVGRMLGGGMEVDLMMWGRMIWQGESLSFFAATALILSNKFGVKLYLLITIVFSAILLTQSRTETAAFVLFFIFGFLYAKKTFLPIVNVCAVFAGAGLLFFITADDVMRNLFYTRYFGGGGVDIESEYEQTVVNNREPIYEQYEYIIKNTFPSGQGLGRPFSINPFTGEETYITDISILSFMLPFGIFGVILFFWFLRVVWGYFSSFKNVFPESKVPGVFFIMILTTLLLSLNQDVYSHNLFVVFLAYFASLHFQPTRNACHAVNSPHIKK